MPSYDPNNIFAKILRGELPCYKVYEDDKAFAFLDIMPRAPGHTLVLPKAPARNILDISPDDFAHVMKVAQKVAKAAMTAFAADGVTIQQFNEGAGGQVVFHLHVHVIPRKTGVAMKPPASEKEKPDVLAENAKKLAAAIAAAILAHDLSENRFHPIKSAASDHALVREQKPAQQQTASPASTPTNTERLTARKARNPQTAAPTRTPSGMPASAPAENRISLAMTPARIAVATARDHTTISESSLSPRASTRPSTRQISFGR